MLISYPNQSEDEGGSDGWAKTDRQSIEGKGDEPREREGLITEEHRGTDQDGRMKADGQTDGYTTGRTGERTDRQM
eukprot:1724184-Prorocentrum_lima.AAC.1